MTNFVYTYVRIFVGYLILKDLFNAKLGKSKLIVVSILCALPISIMTAINMQKYFYSNGGLVLECLYITITGSFLFQGKKRAILVVNLFYQVSFVMINLFIMYLHDIISHGKQGYEFINVNSSERYVFIGINLLILVIGYYYVSKFIKGNKLKIDNYYVVLAGTSLSIYFVTSYYQEIYLKSITNIVFYQWLLWFVAFIILITVFLCYIKYRAINENINMAVMRNSLLETSYVEMHSIFQDNAVLCHDINKHLMILSKLLETDKNDEAKDYLKNLHLTVSKSANFIWTDNEFVDMILNSKLSEAKKLGIQIVINADKINFSNNNYDLCLILGNLLDNAIEACSFVENEPWIHISILKNNDVINMNISNSLKNIPIEKNGIISTSKENSHSHGLGLMSVRQLVEKNEGVFTYNYDKFKFEANVTLFNIV